MKLPPFMNDLGDRALKIGTPRLSEVEFRSVGPKIQSAIVFGSRRHLRELACEVMISPQELSRLHTHLGSEIFYQAYVDPLIYTLALDIKEHAIEHEGRKLVVCGQFSDHSQRTAPMHWHKVVDINQLPMRVLTYVSSQDPRNPILNIRFQVKLAFLED